MNVTEGLQQIRERLLDNGANAATLALVDAIAQRAALPAAQSATAASLLQLTRMLARSPAANNDITVYNDLLKLEEQLEEAARAYHERAAVEERIPTHSKKYYKDLKDKEKAKKEREGRS
ncbi:MAG: hypothetical protein IT337_08835 [Thermomicrobiales bacterium]|nr:hypothetical protein [Thermomicrobiales bacterium]